MSFEMEAEQKPVEVQIQEMQYTLRRICAELDIAIRALQTLLEAQGLRHKAVRLGEELEQLHQERLEEERLETTKPGD